MSRRKTISTDIRQFDAILALVPEDRKLIAEKLVKELVFMAKTLDELRETITTDGAVDVNTQGNTREAPALKAYTGLIPRYSGLYKQLTDMMPKQAQERAESALESFIKQG